MAQLNISLLAGDESKKFLAGLTKQIDRLEALTAKLPTAEAEEATEDEDEEELVPKSKKAPAKKAAAKFEDDDEDDDAEADAEEETDEDETEEEAETEDEDDGDFKKPAAKKTAAKKLTVDDCNDAAKAKAASIGGKKGRETVLALMKKHFKTESVSELKPEQYAKFVEVMKG